MYLHHELREVNQHRQTEALARIDELHRLMQQRPGFLRSLACRYLGNTSQFMWLRMWNSAEDNLAFRATDPAKAFAATRPEGLYWQLPDAVAPGGHWKCVMENGDRNAGEILLRLVFEVRPENRDAFLNDRRRYDIAALKSPQISWIMTFESEAQPREAFFICLLRTTNIQAYRDLLEGELKEFHESQAAPVSSLLTTECYEVVDERVGEAAKLARLS